MHCDYLDFLNVKPPTPTKMKIFYDIIKTVENIHAIEMPHNDLRLPNLFLKKTVNEAPPKSPKLDNEESDQEEGYEFK